MSDISTCQGGCDRFVDASNTRGGFCAECGMRFCGDCAGDGAGYDEDGEYVCASCWSSIDEIDWEYASGYHVGCDHPRKPTRNRNPEAAPVVEPQKPLA